MNITKHFCIFLLLLSCALSRSFAQGNKHALIFAIGDYPLESGWQSIASDNDTALIKNALVSQRFDLKNIRVVHDQDATVKGISAALDLFIVQARPGDIDVIHFSCHGEQIEDLSHHKGDGLEECMVTYDAKLPDPARKPYTDAYIKSLFAGYFREDMFGEYVKKLRSKLGPKGELVVFLDCCHAGIGTRGSAKVRGGKDALVTSSFKSNLRSTPPADVATAMYNSGQAIQDDRTLAALIVFGAAMADELDYEAHDPGSGADYGSLSYAVSKVLLNLPGEKQNHFTYRTFFARIQSVISENPTLQHPVLAGNGKDNLLFSDSTAKQRSYIEIAKILDNKLTVKGGKIMGLDSGAQVVLCRAGAAEPSKDNIIDTGTVVKSNLFSAVVQFKKKMALKHAADGWIFITAQAFKEVPLSISVQSISARGSASAVGFSAAEKLKMEKDLRTIPGVIFTGAPELKIVKGTTIDPKKNVPIDSIVIARTGLLFDTIPSASADAALLKLKIERYVQYTYLKSIVIPDPGLSISVKLLPLLSDKIDSARLRSGDSLSFKDGESFKLLITNNGKQDVYVNILDMQPDGIITAVLPNTAAGRDPQEMLFAAGSTKPFSGTVGPPYGKETYKIFVSKTFINMEDVANSRGAATRGNLAVFEKLVQKSYQSGARGAPVQSVDLADANGSAYNLDFDIVK